MNERFFFSSHSLEILAAELSRQLLSDPICLNGTRPALVNFGEHLLGPSALLDRSKPSRFGATSATLLGPKICCQNLPNLTTHRLFSGTLIVIPHKSMKEWLQMEICRNRENRSVIGLEFVSWEIALARLIGPLSVPTRAELAAAIWQGVQRKFDSNRKKLDFVEHLASLFTEYAYLGFPSTIPEDALWQKTLFEEIFQTHSWQTLPDRLNGVVPCDLGPIYLFGIDHLPVAVHRFFLQYQQINVFRFSPTAMFWEDLRVSDQEFCHVQPLLSKWGSLGRSMLADTTAVFAQEKEDYSFDTEQLTTLQRLKLDLLLLEKQEYSMDFSLRCLKTGTSRLQEVQILQREIARLAAEGMPLSEIRVYAPDIAPYIPLFEFCFAESIPLRISGVDLSLKSPFHQAICRLFLCVEGRWEVDELFALFELSAFYRKAKWQREEVKRFRQWVCRAKIRWGLDVSHRRETAEVEGVCQEAGTWKKGFASLLDSWIFLQPEQEETMSWVEADLFQHFYQTFEGLAQTLLSWREEKPLLAWAREIEQQIYSVLFLDEGCEMDRAAGRSFSLFLDLLRKSAKTFPEEKFPFSFVQTYFSTFSSGEEGGSLLHAVRFASLELGAILPARALFILGMDEENFPRSSPVSSLRFSLPQPSVSAIDRYFLLQAIFAAKECLIFSYSHCSKEDGKTVSPSLLIQELFDYLGAPDPFERAIHTQLPLSQSSFLVNGAVQHELLIDDGVAPMVLSIQELSRFVKNPFQYHLKSLGIVLEEKPDSIWEDFELSALERYLFLRKDMTNQSMDGVSLPRGLFGDAAHIHLVRRVEEFKSSLTEWGISSSAIQTLVLKETEAPLELIVEGKTVLLTGDIPLTVPTGVLHMNSDEIGSYLRKWPEMLAALVAKKAHRIYCLKTGRIREVSDPKLALQSIVGLYLLCQKMPFFLHPEWADDLLRKDQVPVECKDRVVSWVLKRSPDFSLAVEKDSWKETLGKVFSPLTALFERGAYTKI